MQDRPTATKPNLYTPIEIGPLRLPSRAIMAPLTRNRAGAGNVPHALNALYYAQRASAGLIVTEATQVCPEGQGYVFTPGIHSKEQIEGWKLVTGAVHAAGGRIFLQLWHVGRISHQSFQPGGGLPVAPSAIAPKGVQAYTLEGLQDIPTPRALSLEEIPGVVAQYAQGARNALAAGFDGVEIHGANGYLIDQFLRDGSNKRSDEYGGSIENRLRFLIEVVDAVAEAAGAARTGLRIAPQNPYNDMQDSDPQALFNHVAQTLAGKGLAYLHVVEGDIGGGPVPPFDYGAIKRLFRGPIIANGGFDKARAEAAIAEGRVDAVAFGKLFLANPDLVARLYLDAPLNPWDQATFYGGDAHGYTDYPLLHAIAADAR